MENSRRVRFGTNITINNSTQQISIVSPSPSKKRVSSSAVSSRKKITRKIIEKKPEKKSQEKPEKELEKKPQEKHEEKVDKIGMVLELYHYSRATVTK